MLIGCFRVLIGCFLPVQLLGYDGKTRNLHEVQPRFTDEITRGKKVVQFLTEVPLAIQVLPKLRRRKGGEREGGGGFSVSEV